MTDRACAAADLFEPPPEPLAEWPIGRASPPPSLSPLPPAADAAALAQIAGSRAVQAFVARRLEQLTRYGHSPASDLALPLDKLAREAFTRLRDALDKVGPNGGDLAYAIAKIEIAGACLMAAHDQLCAVQNVAGATSPGGRFGPGDITLDREGEGDRG